MKIIGRQVSIGLGIESTRGTAVSATHFLPRMSLTHDDKVQRVEDESSVGVIGDSIGGDVTQKYSEGEIKGRIDSETVGVVLLATLGSKSTSTVETGVYDHTFSLLESAQHPSMTMSVKDANAGSGLQYALTLVDSLDIKAEINSYCEYTLKYRGNSKASGSVTPAFESDLPVFLPQHGTLKLASSVAGLSGASATEIKKFELSIKKNIEDDQVLGNIQAIDRMNKQFVVDGSFEVIATDRAHIDTMLAGDAKALQFALTHSGVTIGASEHPTLTITLNKVHMSEVGSAYANNDFVRQTISFKAYYSLDDAQMIEAVLRNSTASY